jgi:uncharacterized cupin superfamily protein
VVPEARLEETETGLLPRGDGWFVVNAREARWRYAEGRPANCDFEADTYDFEQIGINITVLGPSVSMAMYHWEVDQEAFLVVSGEALLIVEGEERPLRQWDFFHCPSRTKHTIVGAGSGSCVVIAVGTRQHSRDPDWGGYTVDEAATRHGAGVEQETTDPNEAYARFAANARVPARYRDGWLPE